MQPGSDSLARRICDTVQECAASVFVQRVLEQCRVHADRQWKDVSTVVAREGAQVLESHHQRRIICCREHVDEAVFASRVERL